MYDIVSAIIDHTWATGSSDQTTIYYICAAIIIILMVTFIDLIHRIFRGFVRR